MQVDLHVETEISSSVRAQQLGSMFDVPIAATSERDWHVDLPLDVKPWNVGLIVGPSGSGKTLITQKAFGDELALTWEGKSVVDDFDSAVSMDDISKVCQAVGFNTIPAWLRPYSVLSNGEQFRVSMARTLLEAPEDRPIVMDEFTSVVDRQVAQIGAHAVQKWVRRNDRQFVAASCHYDIEDWLQPDWTLEPATGEFTWRSVQPRPQLDIEISSVDYSAWKLFSPFHYLTNSLHKAARCFVLFANGEPAAFSGMLHRPHPKVKDIMGFSRTVTLPDWQGLGLSFVLGDHLGACYRAVGKRTRKYPAHPAYIHALDQSPTWALKQRPGFIKSNGAQRTGAISTRGQSAGNTRSGPNASIGGHGAAWTHGSRPCAVFEYVGPAHPDVAEARALLGIV